MAEVIDNELVMRVYRVLHAVGARWGTKDGTVSADNVTPEAVRELLERLKDACETSGDEGLATSGGVVLMKENVEDGVVSYDVLVSVGTL